METKPETEFVVILRYRGERLVTVRRPEHGLGMLADEVWIFGEPQTQAEREVWETVAPMLAWVPSAMVHRFPKKAVQPGTAEPLPCPFCGSIPRVMPKEEDVLAGIEGNDFARVKCVNLACPAKPETENYGAGSHAANKAAAVGLWNIRA